MICFSKSTQPFLFICSLAITVTTKYYKQLISYSSVPKRLYLLHIPKWWQESLQTIFSHFNSGEIITVNMTNVWANCNILGECLQQQKMTHIVDLKKCHSFLGPHLRSWFNWERYCLSLWVHMTFFYNWFTGRDSQNSHLVEQAVLVRHMPVTHVQKRTLLRSLMLLQQKAWQIGFGVREHCDIAYSQDAAGLE